MRSLSFAVVTIILIPEIVLGPSDLSPPWSVISGYHEEESEMSHAHPCHKPFTGEKKNIFVNRIFSPAN